MLKLEPNSESFRTAQKKLELLTGQFLKYRDETVEETRNEVLKSVKAEKDIQKKVNKLRKILKPYEDSKKEPDSRFEVMHKEYYKQLVLLRQERNKQNRLRELVAKGQLGDYDKQDINISKEDM